jgi:hypothetical protein
MKREDITQKIDIGYAMNHTDEIKLSEIAHRVSYTALETTDASLIGNSPNIKVWGNRIFITSTNQPLMVFDKNDGHFCYTIGHIGNDPGGYGTDGFGNISYWIDQVKGIVYLKDFDNKTLLRYDADGQYLGEVTLDSDNPQFSLIGFSYLYISNDTVNIHLKYVMEEDAPFLFRLNGINGKLLFSISGTREILPKDIDELNYIYGSYIPYGGNTYMIHYTDHQRYNIVPDSPTLWEYNGKLNFKENFVDTIFTLPERSPRFIFDLGKWSWPYEKRLDAGYSVNRISIDYTLESHDVIYFHFHTGLYEKKDDSYSYAGFFNKSTGLTKVMKGDVIPDDINHFVSLSILSLSSEGEYIAILPMYEIIKWKDENKGILPNEQIQFLLDKDEEDNPVIVFFQ